jgi:hypothetical protein
MPVTPLQELNEIGINYEKMRRQLMNQDSLIKPKVKIHTQGNSISSGFEMMKSASQQRGVTFNQGVLVKPNSTQRVMASSKVSGASSASKIQKKQNETIN